MHLVNADGLVKRVGGGTVGPHGQARWQRVDHAGGVGPQLGVEGKGVRLDGDLALGTQNFKLVEVALGHVGEEDFPHSALTPKAHGVASAVPLVERANHRNTACIGRPDRKAGA